MLSPPPLHLCSPDSIHSALAPSRLPPPPPVTPPRDTPTVTVPLPQEYSLCVDTAAIATSAGFIVIVAISAKAVGGRGWCSRWREDLPEVMAMAVMAAPTSTAAFVSKLHSPGVLNSRRTKHSPQGTRFRRRWCGCGGEWWDWRWWW